MREELNPAIKISVDLKKYRIRIYKSMLHLLGNPQYIQLLVNPNNKHVAIRAVENVVPGDQTERILPYSMMADNSYELHSRAFIEKLCQLDGNLVANNTYILTGYFVASHNMAVFSLDTLTRVEY